MVNFLSRSNQRYRNNLWDCFFNIDIVDTKNKSHWVQGILFRDSEELGVITPNIFDGLNFKTITLKSQLLQEDLEFSIEKASIGKNDLLVYIPLEELKINGSDQIVHKKRVYTKEQLLNLNYCIKQDFSYRENVLEDSVYSYLNNKNLKPIVDNRLYFLNYIQRNFFTREDFGYISIPDIQLYIGSPCISLSEVNSTYNPQTRYYSITGIVSIMKEFEMGNSTGICINAKAILDFIDSYI